MTYARFTHWLRAGTIELRHPPKGSGTYTELTDAEAAALSDLSVAIFNAEQHLAHLRSGQFWRERVAAYEGARESTS